MYYLISRFRKVILILAIWMTIFTRSGLLLAEQVIDFTLQANIAEACNINSGPTTGNLVESFSGGSTTTLVASIGSTTVKGLPSGLELSCNNSTGTYAIITSPVLESSSVPDFNTTVTTAITTLYRDSAGGTVGQADSTDTELVSVVGNGTTSTKSTPILLSSSAFTNQWFFIGMEIFAERQGIPAGTHTFTASVTLIPN